MLTNYVKSMRDKIGHMPMYMPVSGLIICRNGKVLLQKRSDNKTWSMHGGGIEPGEEVLEALYREVKEEINIKPISPELFGIYTGKDLYHVYPNGDQVYIINHVFICENYEGNINFNDKEVLDFKWFDIDNLPENLMDADVKPLNDIKKYLSIKKPIIK